MYLEQCQFGLCSSIMFNITLYEADNNKSGVNITCGISVPLDKEEIMRPLEISIGERNSKQSAQQCQNQTATFIFPGTYSYFTVWTKDPPDGKIKMAYIQNKNSIPRGIVSSDGVKYVSGSNCSTDQTVYMKICTCKESVNVREICQGVNNTNFLGHMLTLEYHFYGEVFNSEYAVYKYYTKISVLYTSGSMLCSLPISKTAYTVHNSALNNNAVLFASNWTTDISDSVSMCGTDYYEEAFIVYEESHAAIGILTGHKLGSNKNTERLLTFPIDNDRWSADFKRGDCLKVQPSSYNMYCICAGRNVSERFCRTGPPKRAYPTMSYATTADFVPNYEDCMERIYLIAYLLFIAYAPCISTGIYHVYIEQCYYVMCAEIRITFSVFDMTDDKIGVNVTCTSPVPLDKEEGIHTLPIHIGLMNNADVLPCVNQTASFTLNTDKANSKKNVNTFFYVYLEDPTYENFKLVYIKYINGNMTGALVYTYSVIPYKSVTTNCLMHQVHFMKFCVCNGNVSAEEFCNGVNNTKFLGRWVDTAYHFYGEMLDSKYTSFKYYTKIWTNLTLPSESANIPVFMMCSPPLSETIGTVYNPQRKAVLFAGINAKRQKKCDASRYYVLSNTYDPTKIVDLVSVSFETDPKSLPYIGMEINSMSGVAEELHLFSVDFMKWSNELEFGQCLKVQISLHSSYCICVEKNKSESFCRNHPPMPGLVFQTIRAQRTLYANSSTTLPVPYTVCYFKTASIDA
ncbi:hypothetical protein DdX_19074 [Ditylenchus destructor]|uniref:Uncharacterized protein n=1 Tax=Ditylenchus destructor TaxID=166010 RepID=A0AAD4ML42_9BILA|nr:hypothetical protein DdX_19074 [Ditylenchus destructor]